MQTWLLGFSFLCSMAIYEVAEAEWFSYETEAMTTRLSLEFWIENETQESADLLAEGVFKVFEQVDQQMSSYKADSALSLLNASAYDNDVRVPDALYRVIEQALKVSELSRGAFDISFGSLGYYYDYRAKLQPTGKQRAASLDAVDYRAIVLNPSTQSIRFRKPGMRLDLGGIAKGFAVDEGIALLKDKGVRFARLSAGGDMYLLGDKRGKPWVVGIRDPRREKEKALVLPLDNVAISTSGDYERFFIDEEGERIHHILNPSTGKPAQGVQSVTILGQQTMLTDALSTAVFVLGAAKGLELVNQLPGVDAIIIDSERKLFYSEGLGTPE